MKKKVVCVRLLGGLGNQLFAYAYGKCLSERLQVGLLIDNKTGFYLDKYGRQPRDQSFLNEHRRIGRFTIFLFYFSKFFKKLSRILFKTYLLKEADSRSIVNLDIDELRNFDVIFCDGYFQSYIYSQENEILLKSEISLKYKASDIVNNYLNNIERENSVAIHIRRLAYDSLLDIDHYKKAIALLTKKVDNPVFFMFSDDLQWCKQNFAFLENKFFVEIPEGDEITDLFLMSKCKHFIIANSSFSWWGAWLSNCADKIVIAPSSTDIGVRDAFYPKNWITI